MAKIVEFIPFVKDQAIFHGKMASRFGPDSPTPDRKRSERHLASSAIFANLIEAIESSGKSSQEPPQKTLKPKQLSLTFDEIDELPQELLQELSFSDADRTDYAIFRIIEDCGGIASLDRILVSIFKQSGEVLKRATPTSRIYRMTQKGLLFPVAKHKGVYSTAELTDDQVEGLLA